ncbi:Kef-type K+ transport system, membrane component KefB [Lachnospiraceae bacterium C7]|nr:Kef-type K+ transport system, membrane component KefB [Lachnospiraceae bacterium C7]
MDYTFILFLAIILIATKALGLFSRKINMPAVVGSLLAGVILGPSVLKLITLEGDTGTFIEYTAEIGVIMLMFEAGLDTNISDLKSNAKASFVTALIGVIFPLVGGAVAYATYFHTDTSDFTEVIKAIFVGVVLTATSVSITVETLRELGKLQGKVGITILGAAVIDDILGIIVLTIVTSMKDASVSIIGVLLKIVVYFAVIFALAFIFVKAKDIIEKHNRQRRTAILALAFCFLLAYISEVAFGIADITGAYFAGLMLCNMNVETYIERRTSIASYLIFSPIFFASVGLKVAVDSMTANMLGFTVILLAIAIITKILGCGLGSKICGCTGKESLQVGLGMVSRGEVALIVAQKGYQCHILDDKLFAPIVIVVIVTTLITPILLKLAFNGKKVSAIV